MCTDVIKIYKIFTVGPQTRALGVRGKGKGSGGNWRKGREEQREI